MDSERAQAYGQAMRALADLPAGTLDATEQEVVRQAADALLFCDGPETDPAADVALSAFYDLVLTTDRIAPETAAHLTATVLASGPLAPVAV